MYDIYVWSLFKQLLCIRACDKKNYLDVTGAYLDKYSTIIYYIIFSLAVAKFSEIPLIAFSSKFNCKDSTWNFYTSTFS